MQFEDVTARAGVDGGDAWGTGATFTDVDNDGNLDLFVCNLASPNLLYMNRGDGTFVETAEAGRCRLQGGQHDGGLRRLRPRRRPGPVPADQPRLLHRGGVSRGRAAPDQRTAGGTPRLQESIHRSSGKVSRRGGGERHPVSEQRRRHLFGRERTGGNRGKRDGAFGDLVGLQRRRLAGRLRRQRQEDPRPSLPQQWGRQFHGRHRGGRTPYALVLHGGGLRRHQQRRPVRLPRRRHVEHHALQAEDDDGGDEQVGLVPRQRRAQAVHAQRPLPQHRHQPFHGGGLPHRAGEHRLDLGGQVRRSEHRRPGRRFHYQRNGEELEQLRPAGGVGGPVQLGAPRGGRGAGPQPASPARGEPRLREPGGSAVREHKRRVGAESLRRQSGSRLRRFRSRRRPRSGRQQPQQSGRRLQE